MQMSRPKNIKAAKDLLANFLNSKKSFELPSIPAKLKYDPVQSLNGAFIGIYRYMFDIMFYNSFKPDLNYQQICDLSVAQIARFTRESEPTVKRAIYYGLKVGILSKIPTKSRQPCNYISGELFKECYPQN